MQDEQHLENWIRYSSVWRNVLTYILEWPPARVEHYVEELKQLMEDTYADPDEVFDFFYDLPSRYLFRAILGDGLHEKIMNCKSEDANPIVILQRLVDAIAGSTIEWDLEEPSFDWTSARARYRKERRAIEARLDAEGYEARDT